MVSNIVFYTERYLILFSSGIVQFSMGEWSTKFSALRKFFALAEEVMSIGILEKNVIKSFLPAC